MEKDHLSVITVIEVDVIRNLRASGNTHTHTHTHTRSDFYLKLSMIMEAPGC